MRAEKPPSYQSKSASLPSRAPGASSRLKADHQLMRRYGEQNVKSCPHCGALAHIVANFCSTCGKAFAA